MISVPADALIFVTRLSQEVSGTPLIATRLSPARNPAIAAGRETRTESVLVDTYGKPYTSNIPIVTTSASTMFIVTPASKITSLAHNGFDSSQRSGGIGFGPNGIITSGSLTSPVAVTCVAEFSLPPSMNAVA